VKRKHRVPFHSPSPIFRTRSQFKANGDYKASRP
jgi:hypothetical protein